MKKILFFSFLLIFLFSFFSCNLRLVEYQLVLKSNPTQGGNISGEGFYPVGQKITIQASPNVGYEFINWTNHNNQIITDSATYVYTIKTRNSTLTANFERLNYTVTFDNNGGDTEATPTAIQVAHGNTLEELPEPPTREDYVFVSWNKESDGTGEVFDENTIITQNLTVYAQWGLETYTVTFDENGGDTKANPEFLIVNNGESIENMPIAPTKVGHDFVEWNFQEDGSGEQFTTETIITNNIIVYAIWEAHEYIITFDENRQDTQATPTTLLIKHGQSINPLPLPANNPGYDFIEWNYEKDGTGDVLTVETIITQEATFFAQWELREFSVTADLNIDKAGEVFNLDNYTYNSTVTIRLEVNKGFEFIKWILPEGLLLINNTKISDKTIQFLMPEYDIHLTAEFSQVGEIRRVTLEDIDFNIVFAPAAVFPVGLNNEAEQNVDKPFWIGETEVTYELWYKVRLWAEENEYDFANKGKEGSMGTEGATPTANRNHPVTRISWRDSIIWLNALSEMKGLEPVYRYEDEVLKDSSASFELNNAEQTNNNGFRLPTASERELAARYIGLIRPTEGSLKEEYLVSDGYMWTPGNYASGANENVNNNAETSRFAVYNTDKTQPVKHLLPNQLGLFNMSGNVWEWCFDKQENNDRAINGGSYNSTNNDLRIALRTFQPPVNISDYFGFRIAKSSD